MGAASGELLAMEKSGVTWRAAVLGIAAATLVPMLQVASTAISQTVVLHFSSVFTLFGGVVFVLFLLSLGNAALKRRRPAWALRPAEMAFVYGMATVAASISAYDEAQFLLPVYIYPFRADNADRMGPFLGMIPHWMIPRSPAVLQDYYQGHTTFWRAEVLREWAVPLACWMAWLTALGATMWAWNVLLRRRWVEHDKLAFPCVQLPLELCRNGGFGGMVGGRLFWVGFAISALVESVNTLSQRYPSLPPIRLEYSADAFLDALPSPWKALSPMYMMWSTLHLGICYLIPLDILFSGWFFYLLRKALEVVGYAAGWRELGWDAKGFPYTRAQSAGAWAALFFLLVWAERKHLLKVLESALSRGPTGDDDSGEAASYRWAGRVLIGGTLFLMGWSYLSGMSPAMALIFYGFFWILNVTMTRIYAQVGPPILELYYLDPQKTLTTLFGTLGESSPSLMQFSFLYWINRDHRGQPMGHQLAALKVAQAAGLSLKAMGRWLVPAFAIGSAVCLVTFLHWAYRIGEIQFTVGGYRYSGAGTAIGRLNEWVYQPKGPQWTEIGFMAFGAGFAWLLAKLSLSFVGFPFHPIGYALAVCFAVEYNWPAFMAMWIVKGLLLRYGGLKAYLRFVPLSLGLTLGGFVVPILWSFVAWLFGWYT